MKRLITFIFISIIFNIMIFNFFACNPRETGRSVVRPYKKSKMTRVKNDLKVIKDAIDLYYEENKCYPQELEDLVNEGYITSVTPPLGKRYIYDSENGTIHAENIPLEE